MTSTVDSRQVEELKEVTIGETDGSRSTFIGADLKPEEK